jgi:hypothetical protein
MRCNKKLEINNLVRLSFLYDLLVRSGGEGEGEGGGGINDIPAITTFVYESSYCLLHPNDELCSFPVHSFRRKQGL